MSVTVTVEKVGAAFALIKCTIGLKQNMNLLVSFSGFHTS